MLVGAALASGPVAPLKTRRGGRGGMRRGGRAGRLDIRLLGGTLLQHMTIIKKALIHSNKICDTTMQMKLWHANNLWQYLPWIHMRLHS